MYALSIRSALWKGEGEGEGEGEGAGHSKGEQKGLLTYK